MAVDALEHYNERMRLFAGERVPTGGIVFLGSSHLEWFDTDALLPDYRIINRGIAGDRIGVGARGILHRLDVSVLACRPVQVVLHNGVNDLGELSRTGLPTVLEIAACYEQVVRGLRDGLGDISIILVSVLPTRGDYRAVLRYIPPLNARIAETAERCGCTWLDLYAEMTDTDGRLRADWTTDGLHLNATGYRHYARRLKPHLVKTD